MGVSPIQTMEKKRKNMMLMNFSWLNSKMNFISAEYVHAPLVDSSKCESKNYYNYRNTQCRRYI